MSRVWIDADEWYPVYSLAQENDGLEVEATDEQVARWTAAHQAFEAAQKEMAALHEAAHAAELERAARAKAEAEAAARAEQERLARARQAVAEAEQARRDAMWEQIRESGGVVYDAQGRRIGEVRSARSGVRLEP